ncbi:hypothetical protein ACJ72_00656 [Emergomyces africanus]|uniref:Sld7 C-terminal domain-containing protein n=1 Tax=Emergomyces africanus TaxID=1955775 RepID=A0A1B7P7G0_9EURO|nr:hypothetical protein ACJ72_00656 [Emergomyces africanus]
METWSGRVTGTGDPSHGTSISLVDPSLTGQCSIPRDAKLSLSSYVNPTLVPYYARIGPSLEVHIKDLKSAEWWKCRLLSNVCSEVVESGLGDSLPIQCPTGLLLTVEEPLLRGAANGSGSNVTDILVYGVLSLPSLHSKRLPTPPPSSSPAFSDPSRGNVNDNETSSAPERELQIYAVALCSALITKVEALPSPPLSPEHGALVNSANDNDHDHKPFAEFLPDQLLPCPKRKRMANIFDAATEYHKKFRRKGGEAVSQLMSRSLSSVADQLSNSTITKVKKEPVDISAFDRGSNDSGNMTTHKPRSLSISRISRAPKQSSSATQLSAHARNLIANIGTRPRTSSVSSRRSTPAPFIPQQPQSDTQILPPQLASTSRPETITANKALVTRTILTCMRLYGFHRNSRTTATASQPKRTSLTEADVDSTIITPTKTATTATTTPIITGSQSRAPTPMSTAHVPTQTQTHSRHSTASTNPTAALPDTDEDDDFKAMYHATYRAASFALRRYLKDAVPCATTIGSSAVVEAGGGVPVLEREKATDLVDGILKLFCEA